MDAETYIADSIVPSSLPIMEPMATRLSTEDPEADMFGVTPDHVYAYRLLDAASDVYSRWFMVMKAAVSRERVRQRLHCEEAGISVDTKLPYERPALTAAEQSTVALCKNLISSLFDPKVAEYAMLKFRRAVDTGDKRSFKIRLLVLKSRDSLKGTRLYKGFFEGAEECITKAELIAGCVPDPSPRRLSRAEKARVAARKLMENQPTLFDAQDKAPEQDIEIKTPKPQSRVDPVSRDSFSREQASTAPTGSVDNLSTTTPHVDGESAGPVGAAGACVAAPSGSNQYIDRRKTTDFSKEILGNQVTAKNKGGSEKESNSKKVTVTSKSVTKRMTVTKSVDNSAPIRKTKVYSSTSEIAADIEAGKIVPYQTNDEVIRDVRSGVITPSEAVLFLSELVRRKRSEAAAAIGDAVTRDIDRRIVSSPEEQSPCKGRIPVADIDEDELLEDDEADDPDEPERDDGFGDVDGGYKSSDAEWRPDDNW